MTEIILFAIRHNPTNKYMPLPTGTAGRGGSWVEPVDFSDPKASHRQTPRMFASAHGAKVALSMWLLGKHTCTRGWDGEDEGTKITPIPSRKREEMEVVPILITLPNTLTNTTLEEDLHKWP